MENWSFPFFSLYGILLGEVIIYVSSTVLYLSSLWKYFTNVLIFYNRKKSPLYPVKIKETIHFTLKNFLVVRTVKMLHVFLDLIIILLNVWGNEYWKLSYFSWNLSYTDTSKRNLYFMGSTKLMLTDVHYHTDVLLKHL